MAFSIVPSSDGIERLREDHRRLGDREAGDLVERHLGAVGLHVHAVQDGDRRAPRAHARQFVAHVLDGGVHPLVDFRKQPLEIADVH